MRVATTPGAAMLGKLIAEQGPVLPGMFAVIRGTRLAGLLYGSIGDYLRLTANGLEISRKLFVSDLVSVLVAAVHADAPTEQDAE
jgi:hypothetical protein